ncbi:hypothetical protein [Bacillus sp. JCM 19041]|uniref:hypothetical protein n=1 Tax=Bacillus sp. JCM 19041 TaxID=1460637 RepID=UPI0006D21078
MAKISELLRKITTAVHGKDVRGSLRDGLDAVNQEVEDNTELSKRTQFEQEILDKKYKEQIADATDITEIKDFHVSGVTGKVFKTMGERADDGDRQLAHEAKQRGDLNKLETDSTTDLVNAINSSAKYLANIVRVDGHDQSAITEASNRLKSLDAKSILHFDDGIYVGSELDLPSNCKVSFAPGAKFIPNDDKPMLTLSGASPTSYVALSTNAMRGSTQVVLSNVTGLKAGDWLYLRSNTVLTGINRYNTPTSELRKIEKINVSSRTVTINEGLYYDFLTSDRAEAGKADVRENIDIIGFQAGQYGFTQKMFRGIALRFTAHVRIIAPKITGSRDVNGEDMAARDGINIQNSYRVTIRDGDFNNIGWYGIGYSGATQHLLVENCQFEKCRHSTSAIWTTDGYGEPHQCDFKDLTSNASTLSAFDCHDTGKDINYYNCKAYDSGDSGFLIRTSGVVRLINCWAQRSVFDGVKVVSSHPTDANRQINKVIISGGKYTTNERLGINSDARICDISNVEFQGNKYRAISTQGGTIKNCRFENNQQGLGGSGQIGHGFGNFNTSPLVIETNEFFYPGNGVILVASGTQPVPFDKVLLRNNDYRGFTDVLYSTGNNAVKPRSYGNHFGNFYSNSSGEAKLQNGEVTITSPAIRIWAATSYRGVVPQVDFKRIQPLGTLGALFVSKVEDGSMTIKSTSSNDVSVIHWAISY